MSKKTGKRYTEEQIIRILDELKNGKTAEEVCPMYGVAQSTLYRWKSQYGEMDRDELNRRPDKLTVGYLRDFCLRLVTAILMEVSDKWPTDRKSVALPRKSSLYFCF